MALGQETLTHSRRPRLQNSSSGHAKPLIATRVARFLPVLDKSEKDYKRSKSKCFDVLLTALAEAGGDAEKENEARDRYKKCLELCKKEKKICDEEAG